MLSQKTKYALKALLYLAEQDVDHISKTVEIIEGNIRVETLNSVEITQKNSEGTVIIESIKNLFHIV